MISGTPYYARTTPESRRVSQRVQPSVKDPTTRVYVPSAAAFLIADGQRPTDSRVLEEARRRRKRAEAMYKRARDRMAERKAAREDAA